MKRNTKTHFRIAFICLIAFVIWTALIRLTDVQRIGPKESAVGFATVNGYVHALTGVNMALYSVTDWLGLVPIAVMIGFAALGLVQWIKRGSIWRVDRSLWLLGIFYVAVITLYVFFEIVVINYRPILIDGRLEASYPSSTTMLVSCVMPTAASQLCARIPNRMLRRFVIALMAIFTACMIMGRLLSGVHWFTDIIGGLLLSTGLVMIYIACSAKYKN